MRAMERFSATPLIAYARSGGRERFLADVFTGYLDRPFSPDALRSLVETMGAA